MKTIHPERFEIEFDRNKLGQVFLTTECTSVASVLGIPLLVLWVYLVESIWNWLDAHTMMYGMLALGAVLLTASLIVGGIFFVSWKIYKAFWGMPRSMKRAESYYAEVDKAFLRIIDRKSDRKIHFRQIGDYEALLEKEDANVGGLRMRLTSVGSSFLTLHGVVNVIAIRDLLAEVDAERE